MTQEIIEVGGANQKQGDTPFVFCPKINRNFEEVYAAIASLAGFTKTYWFYNNDTATATTPISHAGGATGTYLTNNSAGSATDARNPDSKPNLWNAATNKFDFSSLKVGDLVNFRVDLFIDNAAAQEVNLFMSLGEGVSPYELPVGHNYYKTAATGVPVIFIFPLYIGNEETRTGGARFRFASAAATNITVRGWLATATVV
ncbi:MAG: hypothetical protein Unbinned5350contig1004_68 [Prokaryotic dsDNA virus sp.]|nr:MAG: hypothetical protein Unbinned5350contig1004_68 [Prokaryotic dsDNA virus sp.]|tara:strand:+ start:17219 stop:17821 length:603 start_codon:yes stop_codon:yes gene_type:complete